MWVIEFCGVNVFSVKWTTEFNFWNVVIMSEGVQPIFGTKPQAWRQNVHIFPFVNLRDMFLRL